MLKALILILAVMGLIPFLLIFYLLDGHLAIQAIQAILATSYLARLVFAVLDKTN